MKSFYTLLSRRLICFEGKFWRNYKVTISWFNFRLWKVVFKKFRILYMYGNDKICASIVTNFDFLIVNFETPRKKMHKNEDIFLLIFDCWNIEIQWSMKFELPGRLFHLQLSAVWNFQLHFTSVEPILQSVNHIISATYEVLMYVLKSLSKTIFFKRINFTAEIFP